MSPAEAAHPELHAVLSALIQRTTTFEWLLRLNTPGCDGSSCADPAFRDHGTGVWRHLHDLSPCNADRQAGPGEPTTDAAAAGALS